MCAVLVCLKGIQAFVVVLVTQPGGDDSHHVLLFTAFGGGSFHNVVLCTSRGGGTSHNVLLFTAHCGGNCRPDVPDLLTAGLCLAARLPRALWQQFGLVRAS